MADDLKPYGLETAQSFVKDALHRPSDVKRRQLWRVLERLYRSGSVRKASLEGEAGKLEAFFPDLSDQVVNMVLPHINIILASVVSRDPQLLATPVGGGEQAEGHAATAESVLTHFWTRCAATEALRSATWDMVVLGNGFVKTGWVYEEEEEEVDEADAAEVALDAQRADRRLADLEDDEPLFGDVEGYRGLVSQTRKAILQDEPFVEYVSPFDVFVPPEARRIEDVRWVAQRITLPIDEIVANEAYGVSEGDITPDGRVTADGREAAQEWRREAERGRGFVGAAVEALDTATIFEFYDMRSRRLMVFQLDSEEPLYDEEFPYSHRYPPFVHLRAYEGNQRDFWAFGDLENVARVQNLLNEFVTAQVDNARRSGNKYLVDEEAWTPELQEAIDSDDPDVVAPVKADGVPVGEVIQSVTRQALSGDIYAAKDEMEAYLQKILGVNDFQAGGVGADRMSATAAAVVDGVATLRAQDKIAQVENGASGIGQRLLLLCQEMLDVPQMIRVSNQVSPTWVEVDRDALWGEFLVRVEGGSTQAINQAQREQSAMQLLTDVVPMVIELGYDPIPATRRALRDLGLDPDAILVEVSPDSHWGQMQAPQEPPPDEGGGGQPPPQEAEAQMSSGEQMMAHGGPPMPADAQAHGGPLVG